VTTTFYLVRHGLRAAGSGDPGLSPLGCRQARATAECLRDVSVAAVYTSPLRRARETASALAAVHHLRCAEDARLRERANWGDLPGQSFVEFAAMWERCTHEPDHVPVVGDSAHHAAARMHAFLGERAALHPNANVVVVTHGGILTDFLVRYRLDELQRRDSNVLEVQSDLIGECSITIVTCDGASYALVSLADVRHL
jgi:broad specificity phosphatase PhoE